MTVMNKVKAFMVFFIGFQSSLVFSDGIEYYNAMYQAAINHDGNTMLLLQDNGFQIDREDEFGSTALHHAAGLSRDEGHGAVKLLIRHGASVKKRNRNGHTPIDLSIRSHSFLSTRALAHSGSYNGNEIEKILKSVSDSVKAQAENDYWQNVCCGV